jgi:hypothetical protein
MELKIIGRAFSVCQVPDLSGVDFQDEFVFVGKTDEEISLVCATECAPENCVSRADGWRAFRIQGVLDFSLIGILSKISTVLAENGVGIFAISTYNTDYVLVREDQFDRALEALSRSGYGVVG